MQLISDDYKRLNEKLHATNKAYGTSGVHYLGDVLRLCDKHQTSDILDYGCGKGTLQLNLPYKIKQYDPAIEKHSQLPVAADIVVCTDVLEHIEPELIDNVMAHMQSLARKAVYLVATTVPAKKALEDGRNAHILLRDAKWWVNKVYEYFHITHFLDKDNQVIFSAVPIRNV